MHDGPTRGGTRGGQGDFRWDDVKNDKHRENYLGHTVNAPVGRWQANKDVHWYSRDGNDDAEAEAERRKEEIRKLKQQEEDALSAALGFAPVKRDDDSGGTGANNIPVRGELERREKEAKKREKELRKEQRDLKRAERHLRREDRSGRGDRDGKKDDRGPEYRRGDKPSDYRRSNYDEDNDDDRRRRRRGHDNDDRRSHGAKGDRRQRHDDDDSRYRSRGGQRSDHRSGRDHAHERSSRRDSSRSRSPARPRRMSRSLSPILRNEGEAKSVDEPQPPKTWIHDDD